MEFQKYDDYIKSIYGDGAEATACIHSDSKIIISYIRRDAVGVKEVTVTDEEWKAFEFIKLNNTEHHDE